MCYFALIAARTEPHRLRDTLENAGLEVDTHVAPDASTLQYFPASDSIVCVTVDGCSCALMSSTSLDGTSRGKPQARATPALRQIVADAAVRFKSVRLLVRQGSRSQAKPVLPARGAMTLANFLRSNEPLADQLLCIVA